MNEDDVEIPGHIIEVHFMLHQTTWHHYLNSRDIGIKEMAPVVVKTTANVCDCLLLFGKPLFLDKC